MKHVKSIPCCPPHMIPKSVYICLAFNSYKGNKDVTQSAISRLSAWNANLDLTQKVACCLFPHLSQFDQKRYILIKLGDQLTTNILTSALNFRTSLWNCLAITSVIRSILASLSFNIQLETMLSVKQLVKITLCWRLFFSLSNLKYKLSEMKITLFFGQQVAAALPFTDQIRRM